MYDDICNEAVALVASLRANSGIPYSIIPNVVESFNQMSASLTSLVHRQTLNALPSSGVSDDVIQGVRSKFDSSCQEVIKPLGFLSSRYTQDQYFDQHPPSVKPVGCPGNCHDKSRWEK